MTDSARHPIDQLAGWPPSLASILSFLLGILLGILLSILLRLLLAVVDSLLNLSMRCDAVAENVGSTGQIAQVLLANGTDAVDRHLLPRNQTAMGKGQSGAAVTSSPAQHVSPGMTAVILPSCRGLRWFDRGELDDEGDVGREELGR
jgi:hypothetical protein